VGTAKLRVSVVKLRVEFTKLRVATLKSEDIRITIRIWPYRAKRGGRHMESVPPPAGSPRVFGSTTPPDKKATRTSRRRDLD
jgi:hypothetical protein